LLAHAYKAAALVASCYSGVWLIAGSCFIEALIEATLAMIRNIQNPITAIALNLVHMFY
jgi:hypothetical protein